MYLRLCTPMLGVVGSTRSVSFSYWPGDEAVGYPEDRGLFTGSTGAFAAGVRNTPWPSAPGVGAGGDDRDGRRECLFAGQVPPGVQRRVFPSTEERGDGICPVQNTKPRLPQRGGSGLGVVARNSWNRSNPVATYCGRRTMVWRISSERLTTRLLIWKAR